MAKYCCNGEASLALHIHEERVGRLHKTFQLMLPSFQLHWRVQQIDIVREHHDEEEGQSDYSRSCDCDEIERDCGIALAPI
jgi:hypothetical protein